MYCTYLHVFACILLYMHVVLGHVLIIGPCVLVYLKYNITYGHTGAGTALSAIQLQMMATWESWLIREWPFSSPSNVFFLLRSRLGKPKHLWSASVPSLRLCLITVQHRPSLGGLAAGQMQHSGLPCISKLGGWVIGSNGYDTTHCSSSQWEVMKKIM